jgi:hypothetical protein
LNGYIYKFYLLSSVLGVVCFIGILANLSIITVILRNRLLLLQPANLFLLNMAVSDCLNLLLNSWLFLFKQGVLFRFYMLGGVLCKLSPFIIGKSNT